MASPLERALSGRAVRAATAFFERLPGIPRQRRAALMVGMGYNFEFYDALVASIAANVQASMDGGDYSSRYEAMQQLLRPYCSEYGIEAGRPLAKTHRELYARFYRDAAGVPYPERYPRGPGNPWLDAARRWCRAMARTVACGGSGAQTRAKFDLGYFWAIERLSLQEFRLMRRAWGRLGVRARYLDAHCAVEPEHDSWMTRAVSSFCGGDVAAAARGTRAHERELAGFYETLAGLCRR
jgi:hypothetical protein